jgi:7,8-dihydropterin-6-yl-methyl-4-(beta-D-ribofuranosyl)aminobenzene 5'-phosphate synthase
MRVTILYDNTTRNERLKADFGFACLVEAHGRTILLDTGSNGALLLDNMAALHIDPLSIDDIVISHAHFDHAGGLSAVLNANPRTRVIAPTVMRGINPVRETVYVEAQPLSLGPGLHSTGLLEQVEQSLVVEIDGGLAVIVGCSHPGVRTILSAATAFGTPRALIGGLHGFDDYAVLEGLSLVCPTHCTRYIAEIKQTYPKAYVSGGAGAVIEL